MTIGTTPEINNERLYTASETAEIVGLSARSVRRLAAKGFFPGVEKMSPMDGSPHRIPGMAIKAFLEKRKQGLNKRAALTFHGLAARSLPEL